MKSQPHAHLPEPLQSAAQRLKAAAREAAARTVESLGLAALSATQAIQRDAMLAAQFELNRRPEAFAQEFERAFDELLKRETGGLRHSNGDSNTGTPHAQRVSAWDSLHLVEDSEVEAQIAAERFGLDIAYACEWELREIDAYLGALLPDDGTEAPRNPLRPDILGQAMIRGIHHVSERAEVRKLLEKEFVRSFGGLLRSAYAAIVSDWRQSGLRPAGLSLRKPRESHVGGAGHTTHASKPPAGLAGAAGQASAENANAAPGQGMHQGDGYAGSARSSSPPAPSGGRGSSPGRFWPSARAPFDNSRSGSALGQVDPELMVLLRRLASSGGSGGAAAARMGSRAGAFSGSTWGGPMSGPGGHDGTGAAGQSTGAAALAFGADGTGTGGLAPDGGQVMWPNLIHAHREELRQASRGDLDHLVIDVIGFLFDQILADPKVPPQMARELARLQLPVLRAALGDQTFFSSRRHPVRRFVNRLASLAAAFEDFNDSNAKAFLTKVHTLVHDVVEGDFEQIELYERQLMALEAFVAEQGKQELAQQPHDAAALLAEKEDEQRLHQLYAERLSSELKDVTAPAFLRDFVGRVWSHALVRAAARDGGVGALSTRLRQAGRDLFLSVQPKATPVLRKAFLTSLPKLMQDLTEGMNLVAWPESERQAFFGELMPAHAEALKSTVGRALDANLLARQVENTLARPLPTPDEVRHSPPMPVLSGAAQAVAFTPEEAKRVGLLDDAAVDWNGQIDIDLDRFNAQAQAESDAESETMQASVQLPGLPALPAADEVQTPRQLADHVQLGFAYQMHVEGDWHKVKLSHVSAGRSFFIFTRGTRHKTTLSLTYRMLVKMCENRRFRVIEKTSLLERATARARRQLASLTKASPVGHLQTRAAG
jgi:hypothetical protein